MVSAIEEKENVLMLNENIKALRKSKGLSQQELAVKLNVVRQTISKWEQGLSVPDSDMLISLSEVLETSVSTLLGETVVETETDALKVISEKLEVINLQFARRKNNQKKNDPLVTCRIMCTYSSGFSDIDIIKKSLSGMGLQRAGKRGCWSRVPCDRVVVCQIGANHPYLCRHWDFCDAKKRIKPRP